MTFFEPEQKICRNPNLINQVASSKGLEHENIKPVWHLGFGFGLQECEKLK